MTTYATVAQLVAKFRPLSSTEEATAEVHLEEGSALLRRKVDGLDDGIADGSVDSVLVRKVLTDAVKRVMSNPSGVTSQTVGPEAATFAGLNARSELTFTDEELALVTPVSEEDEISAGGSVIGTASLDRPDWTLPTTTSCYSSERYSC